MIDGETFEWIKRFLFLFIFLLIITIIIIRKVLTSDSDTEPLTKKLMNFISNDLKDQTGTKGKEKDLFKNTGYDTIGKDGIHVGGSRGASDSSTSKDSHNRNDFSERNKNTYLDLKQSSTSNISNSQEEANHSDSLSNYIEKETNERIAKLVRFGVDYCRASPNITLKTKSLLNIGWRAQKFNYDVEYEIVNFKGEKSAIRSVMTAVPINKALLHFEDDFVRESYSKVVKHITTNHKNLMPYFHFDILSAQKLMIKIHRLNEYGSIKDLLYKTYPLNTYAKKYPQNKGKGLHKSLIILYSKQILEALSYLHSNRWYHMHLHTGNILIEDDGNNIKISELENFVNELPIRNEHFFYYAYENFNSDHYLNNKNDYNSSVLNEIFKNNYNIFEKIDIILFGRVLYEMTTGRELKSPFPDDLEYKELDPEIVEILKLIFNKKTSKVNNNFSITVPEVSASDLLKMKIFGQDSSVILDKISQSANKSILDIDQAGIFIGDFDNYCSFIKENLFNQSKFLKNKLRSISSSNNNFLK